MADEETARMVAGVWRGSHLVREPMRYKMPTSSPEAVMRYLHQVTLMPRVSKRRQELMIRIELFHFETDKAEEAYVTGLDEEFASYLQNGEMVFKRHGLGRIQFVGPDGCDIWPARYELRPTFDERSVASKDAVKARRRRIEIEHAKGFERVIYLSWTKVLEALKSGARVDDVSEERDVANLYQTTRDAEGNPILWVARLPRLLMNDKPDKDGFLAIHPDRNGYAALLTNGFLENLFLMLHEDESEDSGSLHVVSDGLAFARGFYMRRDMEATRADEESAEESSEEEE